MNSVRCFIYSPTTFIHSSSSSHSISLPPRTHDLHIPILRHPKQLPLQPLGPYHLPLNPPRNLLKLPPPLPPHLSLRQNQLPLSLPPLPTHNHIPHIPDISMQDHGGNRIPPPGHIRRPTIPTHQIRLRPDADDAYIRSAHRQPALPRREQESFLHGQGVGARDFAVREDRRVRRVAEALQRDARLREDVT